MALAETDPKVDGCNTEGWLQNSDKTNLMGVTGVITSISRVILIIPIL